MSSFGEYKIKASQYITFINSEFYPDYLDEARVIYGSVLEQFTELTQAANNSAHLLRNIAEKPNP